MRCWWVEESKYYSDTPGKTKIWKRCNSNALEAGYCIKHMLMMALANCKVEQKKKQREQ